MSLFPHVGFTGQVFSYADLSDKYRLVSNNLQ